MSLVNLFSIGRTSLAASQAALAVTSNNVANVNTPNYAKQEVILQISNPIQGSGGNLIGTGVSLVGIRRSYDRFIEAQLLQQQQLEGRSRGLERMLSQVEQVYNESKDAGLQKRLAEFFNAWQDLATTADGRTQRILLLQKADSFVTAAQRIEAGLLSVVKQANLGIADLADQVNSLASGIAELNEKIVQLEAGQTLQSAGELRSQRDSLLHQLSGIADISAFEGADGAVSVTMGMRNLVSGKRAYPLSAVVDSSGNTDLVLDSITITSRIVKGEIGGLIAARDDILRSPLPDLRRLVASITQEVNTLHRAGFGLDGSTGNAFFSPLHLTVTGRSSGGAVAAASVSDESLLTLDEYDISFDPAGANYSVTNRGTGAVAASGAHVSGGTISFDGIDVTITGPVSGSDSFAVSPLTTAVSGFGLAISDPDRIAAAASAAGLPADGDNAHLLAGLAFSRISALNNASYSSAYATMAASVGTASRAASDSLRFDATMTQAIRNKREEISGVSLDEEAANMIRFQRAFEASARLISVADELMQTIIQL